MYNEAAVIEPAVARLRSCIDSLPRTCEVLLIDDGSTDPTLRLAFKAIAGDRRFRILRHRVNFGRGRALRTGFAEARGSIIVTTEGDLSWGEDAIGRLIDAIEADPALDAVFASPHLAGGGYRNVPRLRVFLSSIGNRILGFFYAGRISMTTGMTRAYRPGLYPECSERLPEVVRAARPRALRIQPVGLNRSADAMGIDSGRQGGQSRRWT